MDTEEIKMQLLIEYQKDKYTIIQIEIHIKMNNI